MNITHRRLFILADCTWDYFTCTKRYGSWPFNKRCCNKRFDMCCKMMMKKKKNGRPLYQIPIRTTKKPNGVSTTVTSQRPPSSTTNNPDKIQLSKLNSLIIRTIFVLTIYYMVYIVIYKIWI